MASFRPFCRVRERRWSIALSYGAIMLMLSRDQPMSGARKSALH